MVFSIYLTYIFSRYDPPVADGTSLGGLYGIDAKRVPDQLLKHNKIMPLPDFQEWVYRGSTQYQDIAKRWKLSDEHPGLELVLFLDPC